MEGVINIHGKEYRTVALRVNEFREAYPMEQGWAILSEIVKESDERVVMKASIALNGVVLGTGYAEETRGSSMINKTSALENCETSAIGRALAACGFAGTEYASANEVQGAIASQDTMIDAKVAEAKDALDKENWPALCIMDRADDPVWMGAWKKLRAQQKRIKDLISKRREYAETLTNYAEIEDWHGFDQLAAELSIDGARVVYLNLETGPARERLAKLQQDKERQQNEEAA